MLLLAVVVMSSVVISSVGLSALILSSLQQTRTIDNAIVAYYAAESGAEEAIFRARKAIENGILVAADGLPPSVGTPQTLTNRASWTRNVSGTEPVVYAGVIPQDSFAEVALFDPDDPTLANDIVRVSVSWIDQCEGCTVLAASMIGWSPQGGLIDWNPLDPAKVGISTFHYTWSETVPTASISMPGPTGKLYRLRLLAKKGTMENVQVRAYDDVDQPVELPGRVKITSLGAFGGVQQRLEVTLPRQAPLSGVFDFVVFSECSLVKGGLITCP